MDEALEQLVHQLHQLLVTVQLEGAMALDSADPRFLDIAGDNPGKRPPQVGGELCRWLIPMQIQAGHGVMVGFERPGVDVWAVDRIAAACELARDNATRLALTIEVRCGSWFEPVQEERFTLIASNPPYIDEQDPHLEQGDVRFEPRSALVAAGAGLADLQHIVAQAPEHLLPGGWLLLEHGWQQGAAVRELFLRRGFHAVATVRDYGDQERVTLGQWEGVA